MMNYFDKFACWFFKHKYGDFTALSTFFNKEFCNRGKVKICRDADFTNYYFNSSQKF